MTPEALIQLVATLTPVAIGYFRLNARIARLETENANLREDNKLLQAQNNALVTRIEHLEVENRQLWQRLVDSGKPKKAGVL